MARVTFVHFAADELTEYGISFTTDDGAGGVVKGKAFADVDPALKETVLKAAQAALDALTGTLPADYPPGAITTALMKARNARQEEAQAHEQRRAAERERQEALSEAEQTRAAIAAAKAQLADLDKQIQAKRKDVAQASDGAAS